MATAKKIKCKKCGYAWETVSELENVTCPNCQNKTDNKIKKK